MMFTPHKSLQGWAPSPKRGNGSGQNLAGEKGKGNGSGLTPSSAGNGAPAQKETASTHEDGLADKLLQMDQELFECQYHMGVLLIEKKEWTSLYEESKEKLADAMDALKREQAAHLIAISDVEKREENLRKALGVEKQCVVDLEKALREIRAENAEIKYNADSKLEEANALVTSIEEKSLELEAKLHSADAKLAEVSRKTSEISRKSQDLEAQENAVRRDRLSFMEEQKAHESSLSRQREDLREWEKKLQEGEERLAKGQIILNQREERSNENDRVFKQKQKELEVAQKKIDESSTILKSKEDDINSRIANLAVNEKEYDARRTDLEMKEEALRLLEDKLNTREKVELQKLTDEHNAMLETKKHEFEIETEEKRKAVDDELKNKAVDVEKREAEINHKEEKLVKREKALENRMEKFREKEKDYEAKAKVLKERQKAIESEEKSLQKEKEEILADKEELLGLTAEVEKIKAANEAQLQTIMDEIVSLKVTEEERSDFQRLQSDLKQEIEAYRRQKELVLKEAEDLRQQKEVFERDWEVIDEKRAELEKEFVRVSEQKEDFEKLKGIEEERLMNEKSIALENIRREQEDLKLVQESFKAQMEQEKLLLAEKVESERNLMLHDYEARKRELEASMQNQLEEMEKPIREKEKSFEDERKRELDNISYLREVARREMEELKSERSKIEKERVEADANKQHLESQRVEIRKDIDGLFELSTKLRDQREQFVKERERFLLFVEKLKGCNNCGETISEFVLSDLQPLAEIENAEVPPVPKLSDYAKDLKGQMKDPSPTADVKSPISWLRKCTSKLFKISPGKNFEFAAVRNLAEEEPFSGGQNPEDPIDDKVTSEIEAEHSFAAASESFDVQIVQSDTSIRETEDQLADDASNINSKRSEPEAQPRRKGKAKIVRSRTVRAVIEDAKKILGDDFQVSEGGEYQNGNADSEIAVTRQKRKRGQPSKSQATVSEQGGGSEGPSDSVAGAQSKRRRGKAPASKNQTVADEVSDQQTQDQAGAETRYNLRRPKSQVSAVPARATRGRKNKEQIDVVGNKEAPTSSVGVTSENDESTFRLVRCTTVATTEEVTMNMNMEEVTKKMVENSEEDKDEYQGDSPAADYTSNVEGEEDDEEDEDDEEEESQQPGEASIGKKIGKKLWTFLTT